MNPLDGPPAPIDNPDDENNDFYSDDDLFKISSWGADLSFRELISRYDENEMIKPELQRHYVWDKSEASRFVDSILLGLPVPSIFLAKTKDEKLLIIDGYQRLMTIRDYVKGVFTKDGKTFKLSRTDKVHEKWRGKAFNELEKDDQRRIRNTTIHAIIFMQRHPTKGDTSLYQIFERINSSGKTLFPQEIRNCVYQGPLNTLLMELNENSEWRKLYGRNKYDERMRDLELILRFFALSANEIQIPDESPSFISLKKHLNQFMDKNNKAEFIDALKIRFNNAMNFTYENIGVGAFHNLSPSDTDRLVERFSPTVFDSVLIAVDRALCDGVAINMDYDFEKNRLKLLKEKDYQQILSQETMRTPKIRSRVNRMYKALFGNH